MFILLLFFKLNIYVLHKSENSLSKRSKKGYLDRGDIGCKGRVCIIAGSGSCK